MELKCAILFILLFNTPKLFANASDNSDAEVLPDFEIDKSDNAPAAAEGDEEPPKPENPQLPDTSFEPVESIEPIAPDTDPALSSANAVESVNLNQTNVPLHATITKGARSGKYITWFSSDYDPMTSNVSPPEVSQGSNRDNDAQNYILTEARLKEIREHFMYPYYDKGLEDNNGDYQIAIQASTPQVHKNLNFQLPFFGFRYNYTRVSLNGYLEFSDPPPNYHYPLVFPTKEWPKKNDPAFIGIFFSKCKIGNLGVTDVDQREPGVYFRMERDLRGRKDRMGVEIRERIKWDIREGVIGATTFDPKHMIIVTWKNVSFNGGYADAVSKTNTFQMVLATDEVYTYAIFNYLNLVWTSHTEAGGDTRAGEGGVSAYVGFNAGNGTRAHEYLPYSQASVIRDLTATGFGNNKKGRHIFRIDETIMLGSCNKDIDGTNLQLVFAPESGNMLGGTVVNITGPCFKPKDQIMCKFDFADVVYGTVIDYNRAICIQPRLYVEGYVKLEIALNDGNFKFKGKYYVESPAHASQKIFFKDFKQNERNPAEIKMTWEKTNLTTNENAQIKISLWGYRETTIHPEFKFITLLEENVINTGEYTITPGNYRQRNNEFLTDIRFGFIQINLTESIPITSFGATQNVDITPFVWSRPIPLGWYFGPQWEKIYGSKWTVALCDEWLKNDRYLKNFAHELPQCPCTLEQALADKGRFMPDLDCDKDINPQCYYNNQAMHCVKSGSPTMEGSEQQCCYDRNRYLMLSYDQQWGSSPRRCHNLGYAPFNEATKVPTLSQWYNDMVPKYLCCLWQDEQAVGCETLRFERRPSQDCVAYQAPGIAGVYGDPHIVTFDDVEYTFNGKGEFVLLRSNSKSNMLDVQGRFEQMSMNQYGEVRATQLTAVAAKGNTSTVIEVRIRPPEAQWRYRLDVLADGRKLYFDRQALKFQHFLGVTVYTPTYILNQSEVIIMFDNGAGVEVVENKGFMSARVYLPWTFINKTSGLFGNWSFNKEDDLVLPDGTRSPVSVNMNNMKDLYDNFGLKWILDDVADNDKGKSLFHREFGRTSSSYNNVSFVPEFHMKPEEIIPLNRSEYVNIVKQFCTENLYECYYDYSNTLNRDLAHYTSNYKASIYTLKETSRKKVVTCGVLETPRFGRKSTFFFTPGTKVTFECNQDFTLVGDPRRTCLPNGKWNVPDYGYTECLRAQEYSKQQAGVASGIVMAVLIPLVLLFVYIGYKYMKKRNEANNAEAYESEQYEARLRKAQEAAAKKLTAPDDLSDDDSSIVKNREEQI